MNDRITSCVRCVNVINAATVDRYARDLETKVNKYKVNKIQFISVIKNYLANEESART